MVELIALPDAPSLPLLSTATDFADQWTALDRSKLAMPAEHAAVATALSLGLSVEVELLTR